MNGDTVSSIVIIAILVLLSAYFSATETAYSSLNKTRLRALEEKGNRKATRALLLAEKYDKLLSTILVGNNVVNIAMASVSTIFFLRILPNIGATVSTIVITIVVLIFGEVSPKTLAKERPEAFAMFAAPVMQILVWLLTPISYLFAKWTSLIGRVFRNKDEYKMTQDELLLLVEEVAQEGSIDASEENLLRSAIEFGEQDAEDILTHRVDLEAVPIDAEKDFIAKMFSETRFSRLLVYEDSIDNIVGILHLKDFYSGNGISPLSIQELMKEPLFVPPSIKISSLLKLMQQHKAQIAVVNDEYGGTLGIISMEDILEELVGEIWDEHDEVVESFQPISDTQTKVLCSVDLDDFFDYFNIECSTDCTSVSGWVMEQLDRIPSNGDVFNFGNLIIHVLKTDSHRVTEILVDHTIEELPASEEN